MIGYFPDGFKAIYSVAKALDTSETNYEVVGSATIIGTGILQPDTAYPLKISYDQPTNVFTFSVNGTEVTFDADTAPTPALYAREPVRDFKGVNIAAFGGNADGFTSATFDDVEVNGVLRDDFSTPFLDQTKWRYREAVGEVANGKARLNIQANGSMDEVTAYFPNNDFNYLEAKLLVTSNSFIATGATGVTRLAGYYYNDSVAFPTGFTGNVWTDFRLSLNSSGVLSANCFGYKLTTDDEYGPGEMVFNHPFTTTLAFDTEYSLSIERKGTIFIFKLDDESFTYNVTTPMYEPWNGETLGQHRQIRARVYGQNATEFTGCYMETTVDDVRIK
ncbi:MAG: hypothetical protein GY699_17880 [Desulfobacteraceae bacterium]|nr:hypothetical protein [Desulfobacteraceae bacterium]